MAPRACLRPEILSGLRVGLAQPLMHTAEHTWQALGGQVGGFPGANRLTEGAVQGRHRRDPEQGTHQGKALIIGRQVSGPTPVGQVQEGGVSEIEGVGIR